MGFSILVFVIRSVKQGGFHITTRRENSMDISERLNLNSTTTGDEVEPFLEVTTELVQKRRSQGRIIFDRFMRNKVAVAGSLFLILMFVLCFLGPLVWRLDPNHGNFLSVTDTLTPPSLAHPFGSDDVGHDTLARIMSGGRVS